MIEIKNPSTQSIDITAPKNPQKIVIKNAQDQSVCLKEKYELQDIEIRNFHCPQKIKIGLFCPCESKLQIEIDSKVPKALSILGKAQSDLFDTSAKRSASRVYVDVDGEPLYATLEQIKQLNTKTIYVDRLTDNKINYLSNEDIVLLEER